MNKDKKKNKKFVSICFTPYHAIVASSYANELRTHGIKCILIWNSSSSKFDVSTLKDNFDHIITSTRLQEVNWIKRQIIQIIEYGHGYNLSRIASSIGDIDNNSILAIFSDQEALTAKTITFFKRKNKGVIILLDEGIGLYTIKDNLTNRINILGFLKRMFYGIKTQNYIGENKAIDAIIAKNVNNLPEIKQKGRTILKQGSLDFSSIKLNISKEFDKNLNYINNYCNRYSEVICYLGQPTEEIGMDWDFDINHINEILKYLSDNILLVVKPHPRDNFKKYGYLKSLPNLLLLDEDVAKIPFELINNLLNSRYYISTTSSVCIQVVQEDINNTGIFLFRLSNDVFGDETENIIQSLGSQAFIPNSIDELHQIILRLNSSISHTKPAHNPKDKDKSAFREDFDFIFSILNN